MSIISDIKNNTISEDVLAKKAVDNTEIITELLKGILSKDEKIRFKCFNILLKISENTPDVIYNKWGYFDKLLESDNNYHKYIAIHIISNLIKIDKENKFEKTFDKYFNILEGDKAMAAGHVVKCSGKIVKAKPNLEEKITNKLLNIDELHKGRQKELIKAYAIEAFYDYYNEIKSKEKILDFIRQQLESGSPKTRKIAKDFLEKIKE